ncbi:MAG: DUF507 family protein [Thermodesulfovibrionales bacterium]|nr:DUF507 family protein [Thermodesulfovibrionales bacterium]
MRIPRSWLPIISKKIIHNIERKNLASLNVPKQQAIEETERILFDELSVEDRLNEEVRELLKKFESEIERNRLDYRKLFEMTKNKLVKERNLVL